MRAEPAEASAASRATPASTSLFFTGGVDSFFTLFHYDEKVSAYPAATRRPVDDLIDVWGFDIPLTHREACERKQATLGRIADRVEKISSPS